MAITKNAKRAIKVSLRKRVFNQRRKRALTDATKDVKNLLTAGNKEEARAKLSSAYKAIDKAAKRGIIKPNTAARRKSRLSRLVKTAA